MIVCPRCEGQRYDRGSCALCGNVGWLDDGGERLAVSGASATEGRNPNPEPADERVLRDLVRDSEAEVARLQHIIDCANTPLMRDVLRERDEALAALKFHCRNCGVPADKWIEIPCFDGHNHVFAQMWEIQDAK